MGFILNFIIKNKYIFSSFFFITIIAGFYFLLTHEFSAYPEISDTEVIVTTIATGWSAEEVEARITIPLERSLKTLPGLKSIRSRTIFGLSILRITFEDKIDIFLARGLVAEKFNDVEFPPKIKPAINPISQPTGEILRYVIDAPDNISLTDIRELQDYVVIPKLLQAEGVIEVVNFGGLVKQYQVVVNPIQLERYKLSIQDLSAAITANNENAGGSFITVGSSHMNIRGIGRITKIEDIQNIIIDNRSGIPILIKDVASVEIGVYPPTGVLGYIDKLNGKEDNFGIEGIILLRKYDFPEKTTENVLRKIEEINKTLPSGIKVEVFYDRNYFQNESEKAVLLIFLESLILLLILVFLIIHDLRAIGLAVGGVLFPFSLAIIGLALFFPFAPLASFSTISIGILILPAIVIIHSVLQMNESVLEYEEILPLDNDIEVIVKNALLEHGEKILFSIAAVFFTFIPLLFFADVERSIVLPIVFGWIFSLAGTFIYTFFILPGFCCYLLKEKGSLFSKNTLWIYLRKQFYQLNCIVEARYRRFFYFFVVLVIIVTAMFSRTGCRYLPEIDEGWVWGRVILPAGISLEAASPYPEIIRRELGKFEEIDGILTQLGRNDNGTDAYGTNRIEVLINLKKPYSDWVSRRNKNELLLAIKDTLTLNLPGTVFLVTQPIRDTMLESVTGSSADFAIFVKGNNFEDLRNIADSILDEIKKIPEATEAFIEQENRQSQIAIHIDRNSSARYGINVEDINNILRTAIAGIPVSIVYEDERRFDIILRFTQESRNTTHSLGKILIPVKSGQRIPLERVARIVIEDSQTIIFREDGSRVITVKSNVRNGDLFSFAGEVKKIISKKIKLPEGVTTEFAGDYENFRRASGSFVIIFLSIITLLYVFSFIIYGNKFKPAFFILLIEILNLIFALAFLKLFNLNLDLSAGLGLVHLSILSFFTGAFIYNRIGSPLTLDNLEGRIRFIHILLIFMLTALPSAVHSGIGFELQRPFAIIIAGGSLSSLLFIILGIPVIYQFRNQYKD